MGADFGGGIWCGARTSARGIGGPVHSTRSSPNVGRRGNHASKKWIGKFDAMQNWRDTMQAELPGFRERVCRIALTKEEGGLNLEMDTEVIELLMALGQEAGEKLAASLPMAPDGEAPTQQWLDHCHRRHQTLMNKQQENLKGIEEPLRKYLPVLAHDQPLRAQETERLLDAAQSWATQNGPDFCEPALAPDPVMRIVPRA